MYPTMVSQVVTKSVQVQLTIWNQTHKKQATMEYIKSNMDIQSSQTYNKVS